jgi:hypothetical protein
MSNKPKLLRRQIRAAIQIHTHLAGSGRLSPLPVLYDYEWDELLANLKRFELVRNRGWQSAAGSLLSSLDLMAASLARRLDRFRHELPRTASPMQISGPRDIAADLAALEDEFEKVELNLQERKLSVLTSAIELEDTYLGPFRIVLHWEDIGQGACYDVIATDPQPADRNDEVNHPHVMGESLCEGEGATAIRKAIAQGRLLDFFTLVKQILETYNPDSAYVALSRWNGGVDCYDCGNSISEDESCCCSRCSETVCDSCHGSCEACDETLCSGCSSSCQECRGVFCRGCLECRPGSQVLVCNHCLEKGNKSDDDETPASPEAQQPDEGCSCSTASPPDSLCLEEALVSA